jgi:transcription-repair coupling factor (superfamily II helicase)
VNQKDILLAYIDHAKRKGVHTSIQQNDNSLLKLSGLKGSSAAVVSAAIFASNNKNMLLIMSDHDEALYFHNDLNSFSANKKIHFFPSPFVKDDVSKAYDRAALLDRTEVLNSLGKESSSGHITVTYPGALCEKVIQKQDLINGEGKK